MTFHKIKDSKIIKLYITFSINKIEPNSSFLINQNESFPNLIISL